jgi:hypothetical protein
MFDKILLVFAFLGVFCLATSITFLVVMRKSGQTPVKLVRYNLDCVRVGHQPSGGTLPPYSPGDDHIRFTIPAPDLTDEAKAEGWTSILLKDGTRGYFPPGSEYARAFPDGW